MTEETYTHNVFLEAHYYSDGIRYHHVSLSGERPNWALPSKEVGFFEAFPMQGDDLAIQFQRIKYNDKLLTWIAIYTPAADQELGDRRRQCGLGLWLCGYNVIDAKAFLASLKNLLNIVKNAPFNSDSFENHGKIFLDKWVSQYIESNDKFSKFSGIPYQREKVLANGSTSFFQVIKNNDYDPLLLAANKITMLSFGYQPKASSRVMIYISEKFQNDVTDIKFQNISYSTDFLSEFVTNIPHAIQDVQVDYAALENKIKLEVESNIKLNQDNKNLVNELIELGKRCDELSLEVERLRDLEVKVSIKDLQNVIKLFDNKFDDQFEKLNTLIYASQRQIPNKSYEMQPRKVEKSLRNTEPSPCKHTIVYKSLVFFLWFILIVLVLFGLFSRFLF